MVNTSFARKVMFVNQVIIMLELGCRRLAEDGVEWLVEYKNYLLCYYTTLFSAYKLSVNITEF